MQDIKSVWLIDDDQINNYLNKRIIDKLQVADKINIYLNGKIALEYLAEISKHSRESPELIIFDLNMPVMDGFEFLENFNKLTFANKEHVKLIALTTTIRKEDKEKLMEFNCKHTLLKPLNEDILIALMTQND